MTSTASTEPSHLTRYMRGPPPIEVRPPALSAARRWVNRGLLQRADDRSFCPLKTGPSLQSTFRTGSWISMMFACGMGIGLMLYGVAEPLHHYIISLPLSTVSGHTDETMQTWLSGWTVTYWVWWVSWTPFEGMFIAPVGRGRTVYQFVTGALSVPSLVRRARFAMLNAGYTPMAHHRARRYEAGRLAAVGGWRLVLLKVHFRPGRIRIAHLDGRACDVKRRGRSGSPPPGTDGLCRRTSKCGPREGNGGLEPPFSKQGVGCLPHLADR